ncbi:hypothetical protein BC832DRAFT_450386 [Gaertneriomyces semiglobifer]|nr:hypothetical protein BC832DRAFT_450386 [Gaertneriomyces semiglobifer]
MNLVDRFIPSSINDLLLFSFWFHDQRKSRESFVQVYDTLVAEARVGDEFGVFAAESRVKSRKRHALEESKAESSMRTKTGATSKMSDDGLTSGKERKRAGQNTGFYQPELPPSVPKQLATDSGINVWDAVRKLQAVKKTESWRYDALSWGVIDARCTDACELLPDAVRSMYTKIVKSYFVNILAILIPPKPLSSYYNKCCQF